MHLGNLWAFVYFNAHRSGHFEKRPLLDKLPRNKKSTLTFFDRSDGILDNHEEKPPASPTSYGTTPDKGLYSLRPIFYINNLHYKNTLIPLKYYEIKQIVKMLEITEAAKTRCFSIFKS